MIEVAFSSPEQKDVNIDHEEVILTPEALQEQLEQRLDFWRKKRKTNLGYIEKTDEELKVIETQLEGSDPDQREQLEKYLEFLRQNREIAGVFHEVADREVKDLEAQLGESDVDQPEQSN
ncbi:hypothetical protein EOL73_01945 [Candidatus Saccharibacteria bacterium]|nr:hypothetical protein [Candidatus Saccharibacteria bacterium]